ncbi:MAG: DUF1552 domain-containing protein [Vicinamibacterales bacterium]|nr:DUF1552 domain-containing protein [Vicinamibacterales bacterium]
MIVTGLHLPRRTALKGLGASIALPCLDSMVPAFAAGRQGAAPHRLSVVYVPNGVVMSSWTPASDGHDFALTPTLAPLAAFRDQLIVITGLQNGPPSYAVHAVASTEFLTGVPPSPSTGSIVEAGVSMDQIVAGTIGRETELASLELSLESGFTGTCDIGASCVYTDTIAWRAAATPLPMEHNPRAVFERLFGDSDSTAPGVAAARLRDRRSLLDSVAESVREIDRQLGPPDRAKVAEYLDAVREVERRIEQAEARDARALPSLDRPVGVPETFPEYARLMFDLQVLALQSDLTRVTTFMLGRELSGRTYPEIGVRDAHHPISHHRNEPDKLAMLTRINTHHVSQLAYFLERLRSTSDGDGSLLDHATVLYGGGMSDGNSHSPADLPVLLAGGGAGRLRGGRHLRFPPDTPLVNLHATILPTFGVRLERFANSTGLLEGI